MGPTCGKQGYGLIRDCRESEAAWALSHEPDFSKCAVVSSLPTRLSPCNRIAWHGLLFWGPVSDWRLQGYM